MLISDADKEILEIIIEINNMGIVARSQAVQERITQTRNTKYYYVRIKRLLAQGYIVKEGGGYKAIKDATGELLHGDIIEHPKDKYLEAAFENDIAYFCLAVAKFGQKDIKQFSKLMKTLVNEDELETLSITLDLMKQLIYFPYDLPIVEGLGMNHDRADWSEVVTAIKTIFDRYSEVKDQVRTR